MRESVRHTPERVRRSRVMQVCFEGDDIDARAPATARELEGVSPRLQTLAGNVRRVQALAWTLLTKQRDLIVESGTGSGKSLIMQLPVLADFLDAIEDGRLVAQQGSGDLLPIDIIIVPTKATGAALSSSATKLYARLRQHLPEHWEPRVE